MIGDRVVVDLAQRAFFGPNAGREITEVIDREWNVGIAGLTDRLAVVDGLGEG